jgi:tripartite-type tricarboxylate transporter receptor subunit TctC
MKRICVALALLFCFMATERVVAQDFPNRPPTMIVPFPAGGSTDAIARVMAEAMSESLGQRVVVENVGGASGNIAVGRVARSDPDGYTMVMGSWPTHVLNAAIFTLPYDPLNDFAPVSLVSTQPLLIIARNTMPAKTLPELIAYLKANPDKATQGTAGSGGASHVAGVFFQKATGTKYQLVPYRGAGPAMTDLLSGQIDMMLDLAASAASRVRGGSVKAYAVTSKNRLQAAPDVPTVDEAGLPGFYVESWHGLWVPKGTPRPVIDKLNAAVVKALADPAVKTRLANVGQAVFPREQQNPEAMLAFQKAEIDKWLPIIREAKIRAP